MQLINFMIIPTLISFEYLTNKLKWQIRSIIIEATINFSYNKQIDYLLGCMKKSFFLLHNLETTRLL